MLGDASGRVKHLGAVDESAVAAMAGCWRDTEVEEPTFFNNHETLGAWRGREGRESNCSKVLGILANLGPRSYEPCYDY